MTVCMYVIIYLFIINIIIFELSIFIVYTYFYNTKVKEVYLVLA